MKAYIESASPLRCAYRFEVQCAIDVMSMFLDFHKQVLCAVLAKRLSKL